LATCIAQFGKAAVFQRLDENIVVALFIAVTLQARSGRLLLNFGGGMLVALRTIEISNKKSRKIISKFTHLSLQILACFFARY
jgi:hypothetical protein